MFDLVEQDLSKSESVKNEPAIPKVDVVVYTMPEKFRRTVKASNSKFILIVIGVLVFFAITATVLFLIFTQTKQPIPEQVIAPSPEAQKDQPSSIQETATSTETIQEGFESGLEATSTPLTQELSEEQPQMEQPSQEEQPQESVAEPEGVQEGVLPGVDTDADGLTDVEERLYKTNSQVQDTDGDQFSDGEELGNLYDPIRMDGSRLEISGLVSPFTNRTFSYSFYYPASWSARAVNQSDREIVISPATGEFFSISVQDNPSQLSAVDWYVSSVDPSADTSQLKTLSLNNWSAVLNPSARAAYLVKIDTTGAVLAPYVYVLTYDPNTSDQVQFQTTFMMMIRSFVFTDLSFVR